WTAAPSGFSQRDSVPSVIDSPTEGTFNSTAITSLDCLFAGRRGRSGVARRRGRLAGAGAVSVQGGSTDDVRHPAVHGRLDEFLLLALVDLPGAGSRAGARVPADVFKLVAEGPQPRFHEEPAAVVLRLFLDPDKLSRLAVEAAQHVSQQFLVKRVK